MTCASTRRLSGLLWLPMLTHKQNSTSATPKCHTEDSCPAMDKNPVVARTLERMPPFFSWSSMHELSTSPSKDCSLSGGRPLTLAVTYIMCTKGTRAERTGEGEDIKIRQQEKPRQNISTAPRATSAYTATRHDGNNTHGRRSNNAKFLTSPVGPPGPACTSAFRSSLLFLASRVISTRGLTRFIFGPAMPSKEPNSLAKTAKQRGVSWTKTNKPNQLLVCLRATVGSYQ